MLLHVCATSRVALTFFAVTTTFMKLPTIGALEIGRSPGAVELTTLAGHRFKMDNYGDRRGTAVVFLSGRCARTAESIESINRIHTTYRLREILFVGIVSNSVESGAEIRTFAQNTGCIFPIYRDPERQAQRRFAAEVTPEVFLLDGAGRLVYHGAVDAVEGGGGVEPAIVSLLAKQPIVTSRLPATGTAIDVVGQELPRGNPFGRPAFSSELIFEHIPGAPVHHCSTITEAPSGDLLCLWYGGSYESAEDQVLFLSRRTRGSRVWSEPQVVIQNHGQPPGNAVIFTDGLKRVWIVWGRMESRRPIRRGSGWGECRLLYRTSGDDGRTWSEDRVLPGELGWLPRNVPLRVKSGDLLLPLSGRVDGAYGSFFLRTSDHGATWKRSGVISRGSQPTLVEREDGALFVMMRHSPRSLESVSMDGGATWEPVARSELKNPGAGIAMTKLRSGMVVLVFNDTEQEPRSPLSAALSLTEGRTWEKPVQLESNPGEYSYPCVVQTADDRIHITYTFRRFAIKHVEINEDWLTRFERPD